MPREQVAEIQRARLLSAAVGVIEECGYAGTTVGHITDRARVSRRTFYELFADREECLGAVLDDALRVVEGELAAAGLEGLGWRERVRVGLWTILCSWIVSRRWRGFVWCTRRRRGRGCSGAGR